MAMSETAVDTAVVKAVDTATLQEWLADGKAVLIDVREPREYDSERIPGSVNVPLSSFDAAEVPAGDGKHLVLHCQSGARAAQATCRLVQSGVSPVWCYEAGMTGWKKAGLPTDGSGRAVISVLRQTQLTIGALVLTGSVLAATVSPAWLILTGFLGCGLLMAGSTGKCPLAEGIAKMPWNRLAES